MEPIIERHLNDGERLLWTGKPDPGRAGLRYLPLTIFSVFWLGMCSIVFGGMAFVTTGFSQAGTGSMLPGLGLTSIFAIPFVLAGLGCLFSPVFGAIGASNTVYGITNKRLLIVRSFISTSVQTFRREDIWNVELTVRANGKGDIVFGRTERYGPNGTRQVSATCLLGIDDVQKVEQLLMEIPYDNAEPTNSR
jgi:hypothetical protein